MHTSAPSVRKSTEAIAQGGELAALVTALKEREKERGRLQGDLARLEALATMPTLDEGTTRTTMLNMLMDWQDLLHKNPSAARQALKKLLSGRLVCSLRADGSYDIVGEGRLGVVLEGLVPGDLHRVWLQRDSNGFVH